MATQEYARRGQTTGAQARSNGPIGGAGISPVAIPTNRAKHAQVQRVKGVRYLGRRRTGTPPPQGNGR